MCAMLWHIKVSCLQHDQTRLQQMTEQEKIDIFRHFTDFNDSELKIIMPYFEPKKFKKKTTLLDIGKVSNEVFYLIQVAS